MVLMLLLMSPLHAQEVRGSWEKVFARHEGEHIRQGKLFASWVATDRRFDR